MKATIVDLRYNMKEVLKALDRNEEVKVLYHGKEKGILMPVKEKLQKKVSDHPFFGMSQKEKSSRKKPSVKKQMEELRGGRFHAI